MPTAGRSSPTRSVSPGRPPNAELASRWRHIMAVASAEFVRHGYADANVARIAADAGVSKKTIYGRYRTKDELLIAVVGDLADQSNAAIRSSMTAAGETPEKVLSGFGVQVARNWMSPDAVGFYRLVIAEAPRFPVLATMYRETMRRFGSTLAEYLRQQRVTGTLTIPDPDAAAHEFGMLAYGDIREKALLGEPITEADITAAAGNAVRTFIERYATPAPEPGPGR